ncbi:MAG: large-conductance mechanosensitive channel protein MscL [Pirellulales bacterium]
MGVFQEFKKFALRGSVIDMAVGIIIGGAFGTVVKSLVDDVIMPPIGIVTTNVDVKDLAIPLRGQVGDPNAVMLRYGAFINNVITFLIVAWAVFLLIKGMNVAEMRLRLGQQPPAEAPPPAEDILLLREIRDSLKRN